MVQNDTQVKLGAPFLSRYWVKIQQVWGQLPAIGFVLEEYPEKIEEKTAYINFVIFDIIFDILFIGLGIGFFALYVKRKERKEQREREAPYEEIKEE